MGGSPLNNQVIPTYLRPPEGTYTYGTLSYDPEIDSWVIKGEPCVVQMAKRLFPGCQGRGPGVARFKRNRRTNGDLNWLMHRYPLVIEDLQRWATDLRDTIGHVMGRERLLSKPQKMTPPPEFRGELRLFQQEGLAFLLHNRRTLLADELGLGKTVQALAFLAAEKLYPALIVVPPHLVINWAKEIKRFLNLPHPVGCNLTLFAEPDLNYTVHVIKGLRPYPLPPASIYVTHYLLLRGWKKVLPKVGFRAVIFDEVQELRRTGTEKYSAASLVAEGCSNVIGLSGTPIHNRGGEIWAVTNIIDYQCLGDWESFTREWCRGYGNDIVKDPDLLGDHLRREGLLLRRTKQQVLPELPPKRRVVQTIDCDHGRYGELIQVAMQKAQVIEGVKDTLERGRMMRDIVNDTRRATGIAKAPYVAAFVRMLLEAGDKVLLFAYHHAVFDILTGELQAYNPVRITGRETTAEKNRSVEAFKNGESPVVLISLRAAAGLNLQEATCVVFGELDWSPAIHSQAEDRAHRMGQKDSVLCYYLVCEDGSDEAMQDALGLKISQFVNLMGDNPESDDDRVLAQTVATEHMLSIVQKLKERATPTLNQTATG